MLLVLLEPVYRADSKYVFAVWIGSQIREIYEKTSDDFAHMSKMFLTPYNGSRMVNFLSISMLLVLLEPVNSADFKYIFGV